MANLFLIRGLCEDKKITIRELAERIGRNESTIQAIIRNGSTSTTTVEAIADVLSVPAGYFFDGWQDNSTAYELAHENKHLRELLAEKERTIKILLSKKSSK